MLHDVLDVSSGLSEGDAVVSVRHKICTILFILDGDGGAVVQP